MTTAEINIVEFNPLLDFDLKNGVITNSSPMPVDCVKFCKNLATGLENGQQRSWKLKDANDGNNRMVMIVRAEKFLDFLTNVEVRIDDFPLW